MGFFFNKRKFSFGIENRANRPVPPPTSLFGINPQIQPVKLSPYKGKLFSVNSSQVLNLWILWNQQSSSPGDWADPVSCPLAQPAGDLFIEITQHHTVYGVISYKIEIFMRINEGQILGKTMLHHLQQMWILWLYITLQILSGDIFYIADLNSSFKSTISLTGTEHAHHDYITFWCCVEPSLRAVDCVFPTLTLPYLLWNLF